jgi:hypothetical protein
MVAVPSGTQDGQFIPCPRCGERFPYRGPAVEENGTAPVPVASPVTAAGPDQHLVDRVGERLRQYPRRSIVLVILGVMVVMAAASLTLALATRSFRRANDRLPAPDEAAARVRIAAPADLAGLGYLPPDTDVIIAVHVAEALQEPAGQDFLRRFRPEDLVHDQPGEGAALPGDLERWTGLPLEDLDHVVLGLKVGGAAIPPPMILVAQTRRRYDPTKIRDALKATRITDAGKTLFRFHVDRPPLEPVLWFAGERTLLVALTAEHLAEVPAAPDPGASHLGAPLQDVLRQRLGPGTQAWAAGHAKDWDQTTARLLLALLHKEDRQVLEKMRTFATGLQFGQGLTLTGAFHCADAPAAKALTERLVPPEGSERKPLPLFGVRADAGPVGREMSRSLKAVQEDAWVTVQAKAGPEAVRQALVPPKP